VFTPNDISIEQGSYQLLVYVSLSSQQSYVNLSWTSLLLSNKNTPLFSSFPTVSCLLTDPADRSVARGQFSSPSQWYDLGMLFQMLIS
jgi:hypothetical protein